MVNSDIGASLCIEVALDDGEAELTASVAPHAVAADEKAVGVEGARGVRGHPIAVLVPHEVEQALALATWEDLQLFVHRRHIHARSATEIDLIPVSKHHDGVHGGLGTDEVAEGCGMWQSSFPRVRA